MQRKTMGSLITGGLFAAMLMMTWSDHVAAQAKPTVKRQIRQPSLAAVDHYRCYDVKPHSRLNPPPVVGLKDQFLSNKRKVGAIRSICAPVMKRHNKRDTKPRYPQIHLVCYDISPKQLSGKNGTDVMVQNQFDRKGARMTVTQERTVCVPSYKKVVR